MSFTLQRTNLSRICLFAPYFQRLLQYLIHINLIEHTLKSLSRKKKKMNTLSSLIRPYTNREPYCRSLMVRIKYSNCISNFNFRKVSRDICTNNTINNLDLRSPSFFTVKTNASWTARITNKK